MPESSLAELGVDFTTYPFGTEEKLFLVCIVEQLVKRIQQQFQAYSRHAGLEDLAVAFTTYHVTVRPGWLQ